MGDMGNKTKTLLENQGQEPRVSCRVPRKTLTKLERIARSNGISVSDVVRMSLSKALPDYETKQAA